MEIQFRLSKLLAFILSLSLIAPWLAANQSAVAREVSITILHTTDLHGNILPTTDYDGNADRGGLARCATKIAEIRKTTPNVLLVDAGDTIQGTAVSFMDGGRVMVKLMNHLKYDAWTLGNHEFDWGLRKISQCVEDAKIPVLGANIWEIEEGRHRVAPNLLTLKNVKPFVIRELDGVKVALIGLTTPGIPNWSRPRLIHPLQFEDSVQALRRVIPEVCKVGADIIILVTHQGWREAGDDHANQIRAISQNFPEIDAIIGGHTHRNFPEFYLPTQRECLYCQASYWGTFLGRLDIIYNTNEKKIVSKRAQNIGMEPTIPLDAEILQLSERELEVADKELKRVIGEAGGEFNTKGAPRNETPIHNLIFSAIDASLRKNGVQVDVILHGVLNDRGVLKQGPLTVADAWNVVPYENTIGVFEVGLDELKQILEENADHFERGSFRGVWGIRVAYDMSAPRNRGERVTAIRDKDGDSLPSDVRIKVAANSYDLASGGTRFPVLRQIADRPTSQLVEFDFQTREALIDYIKDQKTITPQTVGWWTTRKTATNAVPRPAAPVKKAGGNNEARVMSLIIDEFCYDPPPTASEPNGEWIVIANVSNADIDLKGYLVSDGEKNADFVFAESIVLKPGEKVILAYDAKTFKGMGFKYPENVQVIEYGKKAANLRLANSGDNILIRDPSGVLVDEVSYGSGRGVEQLEGGAPMVKSGQSLKRANGLWVPNQKPTPGQ